ncbi:hypothetical protein Q0Z83_039860 [Actinoplanes sichuanensis]|nr:hypothetical protein Q0Z83_039860 [Actinoplanes sichuanensis]
MAGLPGEAAHPVQVDPFGVDDQFIPTVATDEVHGDTREPSRRGEDGPDPGEMCACRRSCVAGRLLAPDPVDQGGPCNRAIGIHEQSREDVPLSWLERSDRPVTGSNLDRAEDAELSHARLPEIDT